MSVLLRAARPILHRWFLLSRGLTLGVRAAAIDAEDRVCLIRHTYAPGWQLPGGGVEVGETAEAAIVRKLAEEARIEVTGTPRLHGLCHNGHVSARDHVLVYVVRDFRTIEPFRPNREIADCILAPLDDLPSGTTRGTRDRIDEIRSGRAPSPVW